MRKVLFATWLGAMAAFAAGPASANDELNKMAQDPKAWVMQAGDYANTRYSKLNQINASNVKKLQVAWTFSSALPAPAASAATTPRPVASSTLRIVSPPVCERRGSVERTTFQFCSSIFLPALELRNLPKSEAGLRRSETLRNF